MDTMQTEVGRPLALEPQTWWLSFCDNDKPTGEKFLGAVVIDVSADEINAIRDEVDARQMINLVPPSHNVEVYGMAAAIRKAHRLGVNPGGEVATGRLDGFPQAGMYPRDTLMSRADIDALEPAEG